jgi:hypothetical protein
MRNGYLHDKPRRAWACEPTAQAGKGVGRDRFPAREIEQPNFLPSAELSRKGPEALEAICQPWKKGESISDEEQGED